MKRLTAGLALAAGLLTLAGPHAGAQVTQKTIFFVVPQDFDPTKITFTNENQVFSVTGLDLLNCIEIHSRMEKGGQTFSLTGLNFASSYISPRTNDGLGPSDVESKSPATFVPWLVTAGNRVTGDNSAFKLEFQPGSAVISDFVDPFPGQPNEPHESYATLCADPVTYGTDEAFRNAAFRSGVTAITEGPAAPGVPEPGAAALAGALLGVVGLPIVRRMRRVRK